MGAGFEHRQPDYMVWVFTPSHPARKKVPQLDLQGKIWSLMGSGCPQTPTWMGLHPQGPSQTEDRSSCCAQSVDRAKSRWARSGAQIQCCPSNPGQRPHKQDRPRRRQVGRAPSSLRMGGAWAASDRLEEPEASVTLGARKPEHQRAQSHEARGSSMGGDPGRGPAQNHRRPMLGGILEPSDSTPSLMPGAISISCLGSACMPPITGSSLPTSGTDKSV